jgi:putative transposase
MEMPSDIRSGRHCISNLHVHLVFVTKYRKAVFEKIHFSTMEAIFKKVCADYESELVEMNGEADHVHLLVLYPPKTSVSKLVNSLKKLLCRQLWWGTHLNYSSIHRTTKNTKLSRCAARLISPP